jgi:hypothetical protein
MVNWYQTKVQIEEEMLYLFLYFIGFTILVGLMFGFSKSGTSEPKLTDKPSVRFALANILKRFIGL